MNRSASAPTIDTQGAVLVTGASRGIGRSIAAAFARAGRPVVLTARSRPELESTAAECANVGGRSLVVELDVTDADACREAVRQALATFTSVDVLVNNAGIASSSKFSELTEECWRRTLDVNLTGAFLMTQAALPALLRSVAGRVIAIGSTASRVGGKYIAHYAAAKHGLVGLMRSLAMEYAESGITFNTICPGYVEGELTDKTVRDIMRKTGRSEEEARRPLLAPQRRLISADEVASLCLYLASPEAAGINGQALIIDGGIVQA